MGAPAPDDTPVIVVAYEWAKRFGVLPSQVLREPLAVVQRIAVVMEAEAEVTRVQAKMRKP